MTWGKITKYPANAGNKGAIVAKQGYLHMNAYSLFLPPCLKVGSEAEEDAKDRGKLVDKGIRELFGKDIVPNFCSTVPSQENKLVMNWTSLLSQNDYQHVANNCRPKVGGGQGGGPTSSPPPGRHLVSARRCRRWLALLEGMAHRWREEGRPHLGRWYRTALCVGAVVVWWECSRWRAGTVECMQDSEEEQWEDNGMIEGMPWGTVDDRTVHKRQAAGDSSLAKLVMWHMEVHSMLPQFLVEQQAETEVIGPG